MEGSVKYLPDMSKRINVPVPTLRGWIAQGKGPRVFKIGRRWAALDVDIDRWLEEQYAASTRRRNVAA